MQSNLEKISRHLKNKRNAATLSATSLHPVQQVHCISQMDISFIINLLHSPVVVLPEKTICILLCVDLFPLLHPPYILTSFSAANNRQPSCYCYDGSGWQLDPSHVYVLHPGGPSSQTHPLTLHHSDRPNYNYCLQAVLPRQPARHRKKGRLPCARSHATLMLPDTESRDVET